MTGTNNTRRPRGGVTLEEVSMARTVDGEFFFWYPAPAVGARAAVGNHGRYLYWDDDVTPVAVAESGHGSYFVDRLRLLDEPPTEEDVRDAEPVGDANTVELLALFVRGAIGLPCPPRATLEEEAALIAAEASLSRRPPGGDSIVSA